jgi:hypothetical protein
MVNGLRQGQRHLSAVHPRLRLPVLALLVGWPMGHPLHLSSTRVDALGDGRPFEVQVRAFVDDLEEAMAEEAGSMQRIGATPASVVDSALSRHLRARLELSADNVRLPLTYVGFERVDDAVEVYFTAAALPAATALTVEQRLLLDRFADQQNLIFLHRGAGRQSAVQRSGSGGARFRLR